MPGSIEDSPDENATARTLMNGTIMTAVSTIRKITLMVPKCRSPLPPPLAVDWPEVVVEVSVRVAMLTLPAKSSDIPDDRCQEQGSNQNHHGNGARIPPVSYTHLRAHETVLDLVCRLL